jgi:eukaryotic-like serine/threonine-protein kinase
MGNFDGRYQLIRQVGVGGMGEVWLAYDEHLHNRPVAIKIMRTDILPNVEDAQRFDREMRYAALMQHPNIVTVFTTGSFGGAPYMVMEYLEGSDMQHVPPPRAEQVARVGQEVCGALAYAHERDVIHRDIKPGNLFLCATGQVKVTDFGIAKAVGGTTLSSTGVLVGTFAFMAPEQWLGQPAAFSNDVWATGCTLYLFLSGQLPRQFDTLQDYAVAAMRGDPIPDLGSLSRAPRWLTDAVMTMLSQDPAQRPSAAESAQLLAGGPRSAWSPALVAAQADSSLTPAPLAPGASHQTTPPSGASHRTPQPFSTPQPSGSAPAGTGPVWPDSAAAPRRAGRHGAPRTAVRRVAYAAAAVTVLLIAGVVAVEHFNSPGSPVAQPQVTSAGIRPLTARSASAPALASGPAAAAGPPATLTLGGDTTQVDSGGAPSFTYTVRNVPTGETAELQRTFGTTFKDLVSLAVGSGTTITAPALPDIGKYSYRVALEQSGSVISASPSVNVEAYTSVHLVFFGGNSGAEQVGSRLFDYADALTGGGYPNYPDYQQNQVTSGTSCRSLTVQFAGDSNAQSGGETVYLQFVQSATDQIDASVQTGEVKTVTVPLDGGPLFVNTSATNGSGIAFNFTGSCYTPSGQLQAGGSAS